ncbi:hypothetical protein CkaCkLH20_00375 [Colletotrichum karsti]|uniref:Uncharacterized protein n=1 Tax=Colletotrichum karsti TaxID=1095194 RepID=A0A9P6IGZ2_9PEZI|nr:uncharacterized protein CkaCkLH20_00375 [Colletotrichum karsti]KAF9882339.1 hypothetical protein CkaCkLH20_00375 [Colletotrichum karsti]
MPDASLAGGPAPANRRGRGCFGGCDGKILLLLGLAAYFCLGASLVEKSIRNMTHQAICIELNELPIEVKRNGTLSVQDPICQTDEVSLAVSQAHMIRQLAEAGGGLLFSYYTIKQADRLGRFYTMFMGSMLWVLSMLFVFAGLGSWSPGAVWFFATTGSLARAIVEGSILSMATDFSDDKNRSMNFTGVLFAAALTQRIVFLLAAHYHGEDNDSRSFIMGLTIVFVGSARENWREQNPPAGGAPVNEVIKALKGSGLSLVFVAAAAVPLATASMTSFEVYITDAYNYQSEPLGQQTVYWIIVSALFATVLHTVTINFYLPQSPKWSQWRRDFCILGFGLVVLAVGCFLIMMPRTASAMVGIGFLTAGFAAIFPFSAALLLAFVGPRVRSKFAARIWGFVYLWRSALTLVILPPMSIYSRTEPESTKQFIFIVVVGAFIFFAAGRARLIWPKSQRPAEGAQTEEIELGVMNGDLPHAPPPAYHVGSLD